jgi:hypothetical protein
MAHGQAALKIDPRQQTREDPLVASHRELLTLVETHYERTGDIALKEIIERGKRVLAARR